MYRILIVDQDEHLLWALEHNLVARREDVRVQTTSSGQQALRLMRQGPLDLLICDIKMPGKIDGFQLILRIKDYSPQTRVVVLTTLAPGQEPCQFERPGAPRYLEKPFAIQSLRDLSAQFLDRSNLSDGKAMELELADIIQMLSLAGRTSILHLKHGKRRGKIVFIRGEVVHAEFGNYKAEEAVYEMLALRHGDIFMQMDFRAVPRTVTMKWPDMLRIGVDRAETMRDHIDEATLPAPGMPHRALTRDSSSAAEILPDEGLPDDAPAPQMGLALFDDDELREIAELAGEGESPLLEEIDTSELLRADITPAEPLSVGNQQTSHGSPGYHESSQPTTRRTPGRAIQRTPVRHHPGNTSSPGQHQRELTPVASPAVARELHALTRGLDDAITQPSEETGSLAEVTREQTPALSDEPFGLEEKTPEVEPPVTEEKAAPFTPKPFEPNALTASGPQQPLPETARTPRAIELHPEPPATRPEMLNALRELSEISQPDMTGTNPGLPGQDISNFPFSSLSRVKEEGVSEPSTPSNASFAEAAGSGAYERTPAGFPAISTVDEDPAPATSNETETSPLTVQRDTRDTFGRTATHTSPWRANTEHGSIHDALHAFVEECQGVLATGIFAAEDGLAVAYAFGGPPVLDPDIASAFFREISVAATRMIGALADEPMQEVQIMLDRQLILLHRLPDTDYIHVALIRDQVRLGIAMVLMRRHGQILARYF